MRQEQIPGKLVMSPFGLLRKSFIIGTIFHKQQIIAITLFVTSMLQQLPTKPRLSSLAWWLFFISVLGGLRISVNICALCILMFASSNIILQRRLRMSFLASPVCDICGKQFFFKNSWATACVLQFGCRAEFQRTAPRATPTAILGAQTDGGRYQSTSKEALSRCSRLSRLRFPSHGA